MMIIFLIAGIIGAVYIVNYLRGKPGLSIDGIGENPEGDSNNSSLEILQKRLASGEISRSEYDEIKNTIIQDEY